MLIFLPPSAWKQFLDHLDLSHATSLKTLTIETRADDPPDCTSHLFCNILEKVSSPHIESITLRLDTAAFIHQVSLRENRWKDIDDILDGHMFRKLNKLTFSVGYFRFAFGKDKEGALETLVQDVVLKSFEKTKSKGVRVLYAYGVLKPRID